MRKSIVTLLFLSCAALFADVTISKTSLPEIVLGKTPSPVVLFAADELAYFLGKSFGGAISVKESSSAPVRIFLGTRPDGKPEDNITWDSHIIIRDDGSIFIYGYDTPRNETGKPSVPVMLFSIEHKGTLEATYTFLEDYIGTRWLEPGKAGEYAPKHATLSLPTLDRTISPTFTERRLHYLTSLHYYTQNKYMDQDEYGTKDDILLWGLRLKYTSHVARITGCHTPHAMRFEQLLFPKRPELFALQPDGSRNYKDMCWSSQATKDFWWELVDAYFSGKPNPLTGQNNWPGWRKDEFMIDPHDYGKEYFCQCPKCKEFIEKYGDNGFGECVFQCIVDVARRTEAKYPGKFITTLVYPPKKIYPESVELPKNLRVRMTVSNMAACSDPECADKEIALMKKWYDEQESKIFLWMYLMSNHGQWLYGIPEFACTNFIKVLKRAAPYAEGVFYEHIEPTHTVRNIDMYMIAHALFDINFDLEKAKAEFFRLAFGPAADEMAAFYSRVENNWYNVSSEMYHSEFFRKFNNQFKLRKHVFNTIYTYDEIEAVSKLLEAAKAKAPRGSDAFRRIALYDKYVLALTKQEFPIHSDDKAHVFRQRSLLAATRIDGEPSEADWDAAPWQEMVNSRPGNPVNVKSRFKILCSETTFYFRALYDEPLIAQSMTKDDGDKKANLWDDNETELFFAAEKTGEIIQIGINDKGVAVIHDQAVHKFRMAGDELKVKTTRGDAFWTIDAAIPNVLTGFSPHASEDAFNVTRARNVANSAAEYYTYSPECIYGRWHMPILYPIVKLMPRNPIKPEFRNGAMPPSDAPAETLVEDAVATGKNGWSTWVTPPGRSTFARDDKLTHGKGKSYVIDSSKEIPKPKDNPGLWQYTHKCPPKGTRIRATAWVYVSTSLPDAGISMSINWRNASNRWITGKDLSGVSSHPVKVGEWTQVAMEMDVPDNDDISFFTVLINGIHTCPGKVWIGELKLETVKTN